MVWQSTLNGVVRTMSDTESRRIDPVYAILGDGCMARHMRRYFELLGIEYRVWARSAAPEGAAPSMDEVVGTCDVVLLLLSDGAIVPFVETHAALRGKTLVHFSGSLTTELAHGMHPLCVFGADMWGLEAYQKVPFVCEPGPPTFRDVFPSLSNPSYVLQPESKPLYHALCVLAGNGSAILWRKLFAEFEALGLPWDISLPYLRQTLRDLERNPRAEGSGPIARGDIATIQTDLDGLEGDPFEAVLRALVDASTQKPSGEAS